MAYTPSPQPGPSGEPFDAMKRMAEASRAALEAADIVGQPEEEARRRVEAAGLQFRPVRPGGVMTADLALKRVTATVVDGHVEDARIG